MKWLDPVLWVTFIIKMIVKWSRFIIDLFNPKYPDPKKDPKNMSDWQMWMDIFKRIAILNLIAFCAFFAFMIITEASRPTIPPTEAEKHMTVDPE